MTNRIIERLLDEQLSVFRSSFMELAGDMFHDPSKPNHLSHPGEYGVYREAICKRLLGFVTPKRLDIHHGFIVNRHGSVSTQCDIVVFDAGATSLMQSKELQRFFPVETVCAVGEVKSVLDRAGLVEALRKLAKVKQMRSFSDELVPIKRDVSTPLGTHPYDHVFTFLVCERLSFNLDSLWETLDSAYSDIDSNLRHNMILSVEDGLAFYVDANGKSLAYPFVPPNALKYRMTTPGDESKDLHLKYFAMYYFLATSSSTVYYPDLAHYVSATGGFNTDQK